MIIKLLSIACFVALQLSTVYTANVTLQCLFKETQTVWTVVTTAFVTCELQNDLKVDSVAIEAISDSGTLQSADVEVFVAKSKKIPLLPSKLLTVFENLVGILIDDARMSVLDGNVVDALVPLKYFAITNSGLSVILKGTFTANTNLVLIDLKGNAFSFIDSTAFDTVTSLAYLYLSTSGCLSSETAVTAETPAAITSLKELVTAKCNSAESLQDLLKNALKSEATSKEAVENCNTDPADCTDCELDLADHKDRLNQALNESEQYKNDIADLNDQILELQNEIKDLENKSPADGSCGFKVNKDYGYSCMANGIIIKTPQDQAVFWNGTHVSGNTNEKVLSLLLQSQTVELLPLNLSATFANLENLVIKNCGLTKIKNGELASLTKLIKLEITGNKITSIASAAFSLEKLKILDLSSNNIVSLPSNVFSKLPALESVILSNNKLTQVRYDWIKSNNNIQKFYLNNNGNLAKPIDRTFIWRLQKALIVDLSGTGCNFSRNKEVVPTQLYMDFFRDIISNC